MRWITWSGLESYKDTGMMVVRIGLGLMIMLHGWPKLAGGEARWRRLGQAMASFGIDFYPVFWGAMAAFGEFFGGFLILIGLATRPAAMIVCFILYVAAFRDLSTGGWDLMAASHPIETGLGFLAIVFAGPGAFAIDNRLQRQGG